MLIDHKIASVSVCLLLALICASTFAQDNEDERNPSGRNKMFCPVVESHPLEDANRYAVDVYLEAFYNEPLNDFIESTKQRLVLVAVNQRGTVVDHLIDDLAPLFQHSPPIQGNSIFGRRFEVQAKLPMNRDQGIEEIQLQWLTTTPASFGKDTSPTVLNNPFVRSKFGKLGSFPKGTKFKVSPYTGSSEPTIESSIFWADEEFQRERKGSSLGFRPLGIKCVYSGEKSIEVCDPFFQLAGRVLQYPSQIKVRSTNHSLNRNVFPTPQFSAVTPGKKNSETIPPGTIFGGIIQVRDSLAADDSLEFQFLSGKIIADWETVKRIGVTQWFILHRKVISKSNLLHLDGM